MAASGVPIQVGPQWEDLYSLTGIAAGTPLLVTCVGPTTAMVATSESEPTTEAGSAIDPREQEQIDGGNIGAWARSAGQETTLYVQDARGAVRAVPFSDPRTIDGSKAYTVQPFTELNIKRGSQFYARASWPLGDTIGNGATKKVHFAIGDSPILVKLRVFQYIAEELKLTLYASPAGVTGGTAIAISNWNAISPNTTVVTATKNVTTSSDGTPLGDPEYFYGSNSQGQRVADSIPEGFERVIPANSEFIVAIENTGSGTARAEYFLTWHEGDISTEIP